MVVLMLERVTPGLRGEITRWMLEPRAGVFVGDVSAMVREKLWERVCKQLGSKSASGAGMLIYSTDTEQGFAMRLYGETTRTIEDFDGLALIRIPHSDDKPASRRATTKSEVD